MSDTNTAPLERLAAVLSVEPEGDDVFAGQNPQEEGRLFGGLVAAQAVMAAGRTVEGVPLHSLHAYFLRPGKPREPIRYEVERIKEGRNFRARQVHAVQGDQIIFTLFGSFTTPVDGISHQDPMPTAPPPETGSNRAMTWARRVIVDAAIDFKLCDPEDPGEMRRFLWMRPNGTLPDDPLLHTSLYVFMSDRALMSTGFVRHRATHERDGGASLDHAMWFHRHVPFDGWVVHAMESPAAHHGRALMTGALYTSDGTRFASIAQEGLLKMTRKEG